MRRTRLIVPLARSAGSAPAPPHDRSQPAQTDTTDHHAGRAGGVIRSAGSRPSSITTVAGPAPVSSAPSRSARQRRRGGRAVLVAALSTALVGVAVVPASAEAVHVVALAGSLEEVLTNLRNFIMGILALVATVFLTVGGVRYVMSSGDAGEVSRAKECFKNAALGYALAALAPLVVHILRGIVGA